MKVIFNHLGKILQIMPFFNISINFSGNNNWSWFKESGFYGADVAGFLQFDADLGKNFLPFGRVVRSGGGYPGAPCWWITEDAIVSVARC